MSLQERLRRIDSRQRALTLLHHRHHGSEIVTIKPEARYVELQLIEMQGGQVQAWLDVDGWLEKMDLHLPNIPWREVPLGYLARWLLSLQLSFLYAERVWQVAQITICTHPITGQALLLPAEPCPLLCLDWPIETPVAPATQVNIVAQIPFQLRIVLGYSQPDLLTLAGIVPGDLLLIKVVDPHLYVNRRRLYRLSYYPHQEVIVEEQSTERDETCREEILYEWASLPVEIEFVLDGRTVTLAELEAIGPGTVLPLRPDTEQNLKIYLNAKLFARGELVALENGSLAVEVNHVNPGLIDHMDGLNAE